MSANSEKPTEKNLPDRYPRSEEILIFDDMGELDHVFSLLDEIKENTDSKAPDIDDDEWRELINHSGVYHLIHVLKKACFEFEWFWRDDDDSELEEDKDFMDCMNDPDELQWLVTDLDHGRSKPVEEKNIIFYEPAYHAAARSLQLAMYCYRYPGDKDWIDYCINQLKQILTRYHAAALEIVMHRNNVYLLTEVKPDAQLGKARREQLREWSAKGRRTKGSKFEKYTEQDEAQWVNVAADLKSKNPALKSARQLALKIISKLNMPESSYESVRKCLSRKGFKRNG